MVKKYLMLSCICTLMICFAALCAKLVDDELPGEKALFNDDNSGNLKIQSANNSEFAVSDSVYIKFEEKVKKLDNRQLNQIEANFTKLLNKSTKENDAQKGLYYNKLLAIIAKYKKGN